MILAWAVIAGFTAGLARAIIRKRRYQTPKLKYIWLVFVAFIPQFIAFQVPATRNVVPDQWIPPLLVGTQSLLLIFALCNIRESGFWVLGFGLLLNFLVITLNHGMMPISPETIYRLEPEGTAVYWTIGERFGVSKDIVLTQGATRLWILSDILVLPFRTYRVAASIGDMLVALGAIWLLWSLGGQDITAKEDHHDQEFIGK